MPTASIIPHCGVADDLDDQHALGRPGFRSTPVSNNTTVQVQSSNDRTMFQASANYYLDNGMYIEDTYRKYGGNFSVEHKLLDNLRMKASANITSNKRHNNGGLAYWRNPIFPV